MIETKNYKVARPTNQINAQSHQIKHNSKKVETYVQS